MNNKFSKNHASSILIIVLLVINCASTSKPRVRLTMTNMTTRILNLGALDLKYPEWALEKRVQGITEVAVTSKT